MIKALNKNRFMEHKCQACGKLFKEAQCLKRHIYTIHEGHKDYKCESCGKSFSRAYNLKIHIHTVHESHNLAANHILKLDI